MTYIVRCSQAIFYIQDDLHSYGHVFLLRHCGIGHRSLRMVDDTIVTGSDDWTARVWSVSRGVCDSVLVCHNGPVTSVEYCAADKGIITGTYNHLFTILHYM